MISFPLSYSLSMTPSPSRREQAACKSKSTACGGLSLRKPWYGVDPLLPPCLILSTLQLWHRLLTPLQTSITPSTLSTLGCSEAQGTPHGARHGGAFTGATWRGERGAAP